MGEITRRGLLVGAGGTLAVAALPAIAREPEVRHALALPGFVPGLSLGVRTRYLGTHQITEYAVGVWSHKTFEPLEPWHG